MIKILAIIFGILLIIFTISLVVGINAKSEKIEDVTTWMVTFSIGLMFADTAVLCFCMLYKLIIIVVGGIG